MTHLPPRIMDGAYGTILSHYCRAPINTGQTDLLAYRQPEILLDIYRQYIQAGVDIIRTCTFGLPALALQGHDITPIATQAIQTAQKAITLYASKQITIVGNIGQCIPATDKSQRQIYTHIAQAFIDNNIDQLHLETVHDAQSGIYALDAIFETSPSPTSVIFTAIPTLQNIDALLAQALRHKATHVGLNCGTSLQDYRHIPPYADTLLPPDNTTAAQWSATFTEILKDHPMKIMGGCCGTTPSHLLDLYRAILPFTSRYTLT